MEQDNIENIDSLNDENSEVFTFDDNDDVEVMREKFNQLSEKQTQISEANKKLYARAKKAEGFELKEGKWTKAEKQEQKSSFEDKPSKSSELDYGQLALLRTEGIKGSSEIALFKEIMAETGKGVLDVMDSSYFKSRLNDFREAQATKDAIPKGKNRSSQSGVSDDDIAFAKFKESGQMPEDFKTRVAIKNRLVESEKSKNMFSGPSVIGPRLEQY